MPHPVDIPEEGQLVSVRSRQYFVAGVSRDALADERRGKSQHLVDLRSAEDEDLGEELRVVWELEPGARILHKSTLPTPTGLDEPRTLDALLDAVRWAAVSTADHRHVQAPFRSGIEIDDYQLDPVLRAIDMPRANLLIADDVGLGKTIEAGMIMLELMLRHRANRMLVVCPASLQLKWHEEMRDRFGLDFRIVDADLIRTLRRTRGIHANPWTHFPRLITSIDFLKRDRPLQWFREALPAPGQSPYPRRFDLLVLDEAQNCAPSGRGRYATDSQRTHAIREISPHFEHRVFLSATPHNGYQESFSALLELLDDQRFARGTPPDDSQLRRVMVRRLKDDIRNPDGSPRFPKRMLIPLEVPYTADERAVHESLNSYGEQLRGACTNARDRFASEFVLKTLKKRLFSSPLAFLNTLEKHRSTLKRKRSENSSSETTLRRRVAQTLDDFATDEEFDESVDDALETAGILLRSPKEPLKTLDDLINWASKASVRPDSKCALLIDWLNDQLRPGGEWNDERVLIFTEYRDTQSWIVERLASVGLAGDGRLETIYGGMSEDERERIKAEFQHDPQETQVRILIATECASEGIDLQRHCNKLIHVEIPWNPNRLEQRNGRIDRRGQTRTPLIHHFVGEGYQDRSKNAHSQTLGRLDGDLEFLMRAAEKVNTIRQDLGKVGPVIAEQVEEAMLGRRRRLETAEPERVAKLTRGQVDFERRVDERVQRLRESLGETRKSLRLEPTHVQNAVSTALTLAGLPQLVPTNEYGSPADGRFKLPALRGSWRRCEEGLDDPVLNRIRTISFDHELVRGRTDVVLAHLNHRLVQMSLRLLRAEVWQPEETKKLHRITARAVPEHLLGSPALLVHGRLVIVGGSHQRLHEELITAGGTTKDGRWERFPQSAMDMLHEAAGSTIPQGLPPDSLLRMVREFEARAVSALQARMRERVESIERELERKRDRDLSDIETVIQELELAIRTSFDDADQGQLFLDGLAPEELEQLDRNRDALERRLAALPDELENEQDTIRRRYSSPQPRLFPLAVTLLVPEGWTDGS